MQFFRKRQTHVSMGSKLKFGQNVPLVKLFTIIEVYEFRNGDFFAKLGEKDLIRALYGGNSDIEGLNKASCGVN